MVEQKDYFIRRTRSSSRSSLNRIEIRIEIISKKHKVITTTHRIDTIQLAPSDSIYTINQTHKNKEVVAKCQEVVVKCHKVDALYRLSYNLFDLHHSSFLVFCENVDDVNFYSFFYDLLLKYCNTYRKKKRVELKDKKYIFTLDKERKILSRRYSLKFKPLISYQKDKDTEGGCDKFINMVAHRLTLIDVIN